MEDCDSSPSMSFTCTITGQLRVNLPPINSVDYSANHTKKTPSRDGENALVVDELLCFVHNQLQRLLVDFIMKLCLGFYKEEEIFPAKEKVYDITNGIRKHCGWNEKHIGPNRIEII